MDYLGWGSKPNQNDQPCPIEHRVDHHLSYRWFRGDIDANLKHYLDYIGERYIPVEIDGVTYHINSKYCEEVYRELLAGKFNPVMTHTTPLVFAFSDCYTDDIPVWLDVVLEVYGVKFTKFAYNRTEYRVYSPAFERVHKEVITNGKYTPQIVTLPGITLHLQDYYYDNTRTVYLREFLRFVGVDLVRVPHRGKTYYIPSCNLELTAKRLRLYS